MLLQHPVGTKQPVALKIACSTPTIESILLRSMNDDEFLTKREVELCGAFPPTGCRVRLVPFVIPEYLPALCLERWGSGLREQNRVYTTELESKMQNNNLDKE